jgi:multidrug efflux pump subunit AcrB
VTEPGRIGPAGRLAHMWINSKLTPLLIGASLLIGGFAVWKLPREEEPQIIVPMVDVFVEMPGASAREVEERVTKPMEKLLWEIPGVEYLYSTSSPGSSIVIVRFLVGQDEEKSICSPESEADGQLRPDPAGSIEATCQAPFHRRCSDPRAGPLQ